MRAYRDFLGTALFSIELQEWNLITEKAKMSDDNEESELYDNFRLTIQEKTQDKNVSGKILNFRLYINVFWL